MTLRWIFKILAIVIVLFIMPVGCMVAAHYSGDSARFRHAYGSSSSQQAPSADSNEAVILVYAARAARWRGAFGVHTWFATKRSDERQYTRLEVIGYRLYWGNSTVQMRRGNADSNWFGNRPTLLREIRGGQQVDDMIERLFTSAENYPYANEYHVWPGPNSNTFIAHLARQVPELRLELPPNAIGKDYLPYGALAAFTPSGTGAQLSAGGYAGVLLGFEEGIELNLAGLTVGLDLLPPAIKLPGVGRIGFADTRKLQLE